MDFKNRLKHCRDLKGYTLKYIADRVGVTEATVQRWESGNIKSLRHIRIAKLSEVLGVSPAYLMGWDESHPTFGTHDHTPTLTPPLTPHESTVITAYRKQPAMQPAVDRLLGVTPIGESDAVPLVRDAAFGDDIFISEATGSPEEAAEAKRIDDYHSDGF